MSYDTWKAGYPRAIGPAQDQTPNRNPKYVRDERIAILENRLARFCKSEAERERTREELARLRAEQ